MKKIILFLLILAFFSQTAFAHQPRIVDQEVTKVENPEISQAFYGELSGTSELFEINSNEPFNLYVGLLVPNIDNATTDYSATITSENFYEILDGESFEWTEFFEEFAGDDYFKGPEYEKEVNAGTYKIEVSSPDNEGKYVIAIGKKEEFPIPEIINTIKLLPKLKSDFFEKPAYTAYFNIIGLFLLGTILILAGIVVLVVYIIKKIKK